jgi:hypothetical protein
LPASSPSLPFSRVGPFISSFSSWAATVALGNQVVTLSSPPSEQKDTISRSLVPPRF